MWISDLFPGWTIEEILRVNELALMAALVLISVFAVGALGEERSGYMARIKMEHPHGYSRYREATKASHLKF